MLPSRLFSSARAVTEVLVRRLLTTLVPMISRYLLAFALGLACVLPATAQEYAPAYERGADIASGPEVVLVYFGASTCGPCRTSEFKAALERAKVLLAERAAQDGKTFSVIGVALDYNVEDGLAFLAESGRFDELVVGRNWFNSAALTHVWRPEGLKARPQGLPGIMVFERDLSMGEAGIAAGDPEYLVELVGGEAIPAWVEAGAPSE